MDYPREFEVVPPAVPIVDPAISGSIVMRLLTEPGLAAALVATTLEVNPALQGVVDALGPEYDRESVLAGMALAFEVMGRQGAHDTTEKTNANTEYVDAAIIRATQESPHIARISSDTILLARDTALAILRASPAEVLRIVVHLDRSPDDLIAIALKKSGDSLYAQYQELIKTSKGDRLAAIEQTRDMLGLRMFRLAFYRAHCAPDASNIEAVRKHPDRDGGEMLIHRLMLWRPHSR